MKNLFILFILAMCLTVNAQNDYILMSRHRPIICVEINGNKEAMLLDTGSELNILDKHYKAEKYISKLTAQSTTDNFTLYKVEKTDFKVFGRNINNFYSADLALMIDNISASTGIKVVGILGTPAIKELKMVIDLSRGIVTINKNSATTVSTD